MRSMVSSSMGGQPAWSCYSGSKVLSANRSPESRTSGSTTSTAVGTPRAGFATDSAAGRTLTGLAIGHLEEAHPPELRELALVGVEHEPARELETHLQHRALSL